MKALKFCFLLVMAITLVACEKEETWEKDEMACVEQDEMGCWTKIEDDCDCKCGDKSGKHFGKKGKKGKKHGKKGNMLKKIKYMTACNDTTFMDLNNLPANVVYYEVKPLAYDSTGTCIVKGMTKFVDTLQNQTLAMVNYFPVLKTGYAVKVNCVNGDCKDKAATVCKVKSACVNVTPSL